jgi:hypothetical protein
LSPLVLRKTPISSEEDGLLKHRRLVRDETSYLVPLYLLLSFALLEKSPSLDPFARRNEPGKFRSIGDTCLGHAKSCEGLQEAGDEESAEGDEKHSRSPIRTKLPT